MTSYIQTPKTKDQYLRQYVNFLPSASTMLQKSSPAYKSNTSTIVAQNNATPTKYNGLTSK